MARRLRLQLAGGHYHLVCRGNRGQQIFSDDTDRQRFLDTLGECCGRTGWRVHGFCLLSDHVHLLVETPAPNLVVGMKWMLGTYTLRFNNRHKHHGHLFQGRYRSSHVSPQGGFLAAAADYIHLNPARAHLIDPSQPLRAYVWTSLRCYLQRRGRPQWLTAVDVLAGCGGLADTPAGRARYEQRLETARAQDRREEFDRLRRDWCFGDEAFRERLLGEVERQAGRRRSSHYGPEIQEAAEANANRLIDRELKALGAGRATLKVWRKGDPRKIRIAQRLRLETTMTLAWITEQLHMGVRSHLVHLLYWENRRKRERRMGRRMRPVRKEPRSRRQREDLPQNMSLLHTDPFPALSLPLSLQELDPRFD